MRFVLILVATATAFVLGPIVTSIDAQKFSVEEDLEFARGLMNRRMHDIAKATLDAIIDNPDASSGEKASANLEIANLYKDKFRRGLTYQERIDASEAADRAYQDFITNFSDHPRIVQAKVDFAEFLVYLGRYRTRLYEETIQVGGSQEEANQHRDIALEKLKKAADLLDELIVLLPAMGREDLNPLLELVRFYRAILYYDLGKAEKDEASRMATFQEGINQLEDYIFENEDNLRGFRGYLYKALCHREFNDPSQRRDAIASFEGILNAFRNVVSNPDLGWRNWTEVFEDIGAKDLVETTYWRFAETLNQFGEYQKAVEKVEDFKRLIKEGKSKLSDPGFRALLEQARAFFLDGKVNEAIGIVSDVSTEAGTANKYIQFHCDRLLARLLDDVDDKSKLDSEVVFKAAKGSYGQERYYDALRHFQTVLAIEKGLGQKALECWEFIGRCYQKMGFEREYALATATGAFKLKSIDGIRATDMARKAKLSLTKIAKTTGSAKDRTRLNKHKEMTAQVFGSPVGADYEPAEQAMREGKYELAIEYFGNVDASAEKYELAQAYITYCMNRLAEKKYSAAVNGKVSKNEREAAREAYRNDLNKTLAKVDSFIKGTESRSVRGEPIKKSNRDQAMGIALLSKMEALKDLDRWDDGLKVAAFFESGQVSNADHLAKASVLKALLLLGKKNLQQAEEAIQRIEKKYASSADAQRSLITLKGILGAEYKNLADQLEKKKRKTEAINALLKSVAYRHTWVNSISDPQIENLFTLAKDLFDLNRFDQAKSYLDAILKRWGDDTKARGALKTTIRLARLYLARCLMWQGKYLEAQAIFKDLHNARKTDKGLMKEYAEVLTGTMRVVNGQMVYLPGRGAHKDDALDGYRIWARLAKIAQREATPESIKDFLEARFHQNLVRWAQKMGDKAQTNIRQLRVALGKNLDRPKGSSQDGYWEKRFDWLEKQIGRPAPQTPPPMPSPLGSLPSDKK